MHDYLPAMLPMRGTFTASDDPNFSIGVTAGAKSLSVKLSIGYGQTHDFHLIHVEGLLEVVAQNGSFDWRSNQSVCAILKTQD